jgi:hypothetical protein
MKKIILFELNEVPFRVMDDYCEMHPESALNEFYSQSACASTFSPDEASLHPWCTWPTLHRGVPTSEHMLTNLSEELTEVDAEFPPVWKILARQDVSIGLGGSLHSWPPPEDLSAYDFYLPDTFASDSQAYPEELAVFQAFNLAMVDRSARNVSKSIAPKEAFEVLLRFRKLGFRASTVSNIGAQLLQELVNPVRKGRRRILQSVLAFDCFMKQLESKKPDFSTFFTNHVASSMHRYWVAKFPQDFGNSEYDANFIETYGGEIDFAMSVADRFLRRVMKFAKANPEYAIVLATSMGQAACEEKVIARQVYVQDARLFMAAMGVEAHEFSRRRVMAPRFAVVVDEQKVPVFRDRAEKMKVAGSPVRFEEKSDGYFMIHFGQPNLNAEEEFARIDNEEMPFASVGLENTLIEDAAGSTGYHIPTGMLMVYDPAKRGGSRLGSDIPATEIAPMLLSNYNTPVPSYMHSSPVMQI